MKIKRQSLQNKIVHWGVAFSVFALIFTGILQMPVAKRYMLNELPLMGWSANYHTSLIVHYIFGGMLMFFAFLHVFFHLARKEFDIFPKKGDLKLSFIIIKAMILKQKEPPCDKYLPEQRIAYIVIAFILGLLIVTGFIKTYKNLQGYNLSENLMFWTTQLHNLGMFLIILAIFGHLFAFVFKQNRPLLSSMFSGKVDAKYVLHRHSLWEEGVKEAKEKLNQ